MYIYDSTKRENPLTTNNIIITKKSLQKNSYILMEYCLKNYQ